jgi:hypothetical protein
MYLKGFVWLNGRWEESDACEMRLEVQGLGIRVRGIV